MKARFVYEALEFERGQDPKEIIRNWGDNEAYVSFWYAGYSSTSRSTMNSKLRSLKSKLKSLRKNGEIKGFTIIEERDFSGTIIIKGGSKPADEITKLFIPDYGSWEGKIIDIDSAESAMKDGWEYYKEM